MNRKVFKTLILLGSFAVPCLLYILLWSLTKQDTINRIGYILWLRASIDGPLSWTRVKTVEVFFQAVVPVLIGLIGFRYGWIWMKRRGY